MRSDRIALGLGAAAVAAVATPALAAETVTYGYDARGRLVQVTRGGSAQGGATVVTHYALDRADNRTGKTTGGSPNPPPP